MTPELKPDYPLVLAVVLALVLFGVLYNWLIGWMERRGYTDGFLSLLVAFGALITLCGVAALSIRAAIYALVCFIAAGLPMIIGSLVRYITARAAMHEALRDIAQGSKK